MFLGYIFILLIVFDVLWFLLYLEISIVVLLNVIGILNEILFRVRINDKIVVYILSDIIVK